jgi:hypothetical protein
MSGLAKLTADDLVKADVLHRPYCNVSTGLRNHLAEIGYVLPPAMEFARDEDVLLYLGISDAIAVMPAPPEAISSLTIRPFEGLDLGYSLHATCVSGRQRGPTLNLFLSQLRAADWQAVAA